MERLYFNPTPTSREGEWVKWVFFYHMQIHQTPKTRFNLTSKKHLYIFKKYVLVKVNLKVLLLFYFCSTFSSLLLFFSSYSNSILFYSILWRWSHL